MLADSSECANHRSKRASDRFSTLSPYHAHSWWLLLSPASPFAAYRLTTLSYSPRRLSGTCARHVRCASSKSCPEDWMQAHRKSGTSTARI